MEIAQLQAFLAVAEQRSFSLAAEALFITQPAVSKRIQTLETQLGRTLFDRLGKQVSLAPAGHALLPAARRVLAEVANCEAELSSMDGQVAGTLAFGASHHIGLRYLPSLLRNYIASHPHVRLDLQLNESEESLARVLDASLELAVITLPLSLPAGVLSECLWPDPLVFCAAPDHPLASAASLSPAALVEHTALLPTHATATRRLLEQQLQPLGLRLGQVMETNYLETNKVLAEAGLGWTLLPKSMQSPQLCALPVERITLHRELGVVRREGRTLSAPALAMLGLLRSDSGATQKSG